jgi:uncharacterized protein
MFAMFETDLRRKLMLGAVSLAVLLGGLGSAAWAMQRDPAYAAARSQGLVGEQPDGYLGFVSTPSSAIRALVEDLNIKRRAIYTERAAAQNATVEQYAFTTGCSLIAQTVAGEKYKAPDGSWQTRGAAAPLRDARCPAAG